MQAQAMTQKVDEEKVPDKDKDKDDDTTLNKKFQ